MAITKTSKNGDSIDVLYKRGHPSMFHSGLNFKRHQLRSLHVVATDDKSSKVAALGRENPGANRNIKESLKMAGHRLP